MEPRRPSSSYRARGSKRRRDCPLMIGRAARGPFQASVLLAGSTSAASHTAKESRNRAWGTMRLFAWQGET
eukprot:6852794-Alexandrium_andersonii.AAC.1